MLILPEDQRNDLALRSDIEDQMRKMQERFSRRGRGNGGGGGRRPPSLGPGGFIFLGKDENIHPIQPTLKPSRDMRGAWVPVDRQETSEQAA